MPVILRQLELNDIPIVSQIAHLASCHPWSAEVFYDCFKADYCAWVLCQEVDRFSNSVIGFVIGLCQVGECQLLNIAVHPHHQQQGHGKILLKHIINYARTNRCARVTLEVRRSNTIALALYQSLGFIEIGVRRQYYPANIGREDAKVLALSLD